MGAPFTSRPYRIVPLPFRAVAAILLALAGVLELSAWVFRSVPSLGALNVLAGSWKAALYPLMARYWPIREWVFHHPAAAVAGLVVTLAAALGAYRMCLLFWHNELVARLTGTRFVPDDGHLPSVAVDLVEELRLKPAGHYFVGLTGSRGFLGWRWRPAYVSQRQKTMHAHVLGKTGSGKTASILMPGLLQDILDGKGALFMSAKGSDEEIGMMKAIAQLAGREAELKVFGLPAWSQPQIFSHTYNMVFVRPRSRADSGGDPVAVAERVYSVMPLGDNEYYNVQGQIAFTNLCRLLHGMVDEDGNGLPFVLRDIAVCFKGMGGGGGWSRAYEHCLEKSLDREAALSLEAQTRQLGRDAGKTFSGITGALEKFMSPIVNAYAPDIVFEEVLEKNLLVYVQLPANLFKVQAPAMGKAMLMDVQQEGSLRQVFRSTRNQRPFAVTVDEFYNFADVSIVDSLNKLRDANLEYTLAHQSIADLELVSKEFAAAVWDNTRTKHILNQDNPELCEKVAKSIGTCQQVSKTVRQQQGALFTSLTTGDASTKLVEVYRLHPNRIKELARCGQGYLYSDEGLKPVFYGMVPPLRADFAIQRKQQEGARGLRLFERFVTEEGAAGQHDLGHLIHGERTR